MRAAAPLRSAHRASVGVMQPIIVVSPARTPARITSGSVLVKPKRPCAVLPSPIA